MEDERVDDRQLFEMLLSRGHWRAAGGLLCDWLTFVLDCRSTHHAHDAASLFSEYLMAIVRDEDGQKLPHWLAQWKSGHQEHQEAVSHELYSIALSLAAETAEI